MTAVSNYYSKQGELFRVDETITEEAQREAQTAVRIARKAMPKSMRESSESWGPTAKNARNVRHYVLTPSYRTSSGLCCVLPDFGRGCVGSGKGNGDAAAIVFLIFAIIALVISVGVAIGYSAYHGNKADSARKTLNDVKKKREVAQNQMVQKTYDQIIPVLQRKFAKNSAKAAFSATSAAGCLVLIAACSIAIYAIVSNNSFYLALSKNLAYAGAGVVGSGFAAHAILYAYQCSRKEARKEEGRRIAAAFSALDSHIVHPFTILEQYPVNTVLKMNQTLYARTGDEQFQTISSHAAKALQNSTEIFVEQRTSEEVD